MKLLFKVFWENHGLKLLLWWKSNQNIIFDKRLSQMREITVDNKNKIQYISIDHKFILSYIIKVSVSKLR